MTVPVIASDKTNATLDANDHPTHHNLLAAGVNQHETRLTAVEASTVLMPELLAPAPSGSDDTSAIQALLTAHPGRTIRLQDTPVTPYQFAGALAGSNSLVSKLVGQSRNLTRLQWTADQGTNGSVKAITGLVSLEGLGLYGPGPGSQVPGMPGGNMTLLRTSSAMTYRDLVTEQWYAGIEIGGDHEILADIYASNNWYGVYWGGSPATLGDQELRNINCASSRFASIGVAPDNGITSALLSKIHMGFSPYCIFGECTPAGTRSQPILNGAELVRGGFEIAGNGTIFDQGFCSTIQDTRFVHVDEFNTFNSSYKAANSTATGDTTNGSSTITNVATTGGTAPLKVGMYVTGAGIPASTKIATVSGTSITLVNGNTLVAATATATATGVALTGSWPQDYSVQALNIFRTQLIGDNATFGVVGAKGFILVKQLSDSWFELGAQIDNSVTAGVPWIQTGPYVGFGGITIRSGGLFRGNPFKFARQYTSPSTTLKGHWVSLYNERSGGVDFGEYAIRNSSYFPWGVALAPAASAQQIIPVQISGRVAVLTNTAGLIQSNMVKPDGANQGQVLQGTLGTDHPILGQVAAAPEGGSAPYLVQVDFRPFY